METEGANWSRAREGAGLGKGPMRSGGLVGRKLRDPDGATKYAKFRGILDRMGSLYVLSIDGCVVIGTFSQWLVFMNVSD